MTEGQSHLGIESQVFGSDVDDDPAEQRRRGSRGSRERGRVQKAAAGVRVLTRLKWLEREVWNTMG